MPVQLNSLPYGQALCVLAVAQLAGALFLHSLTPHLRPGLPRLVAALPVLAADVSAPLLFQRSTDVTTIVLVAFNTAWLSSFKTLLWAYGRSVLGQRRLSAPQFVALQLAPLTPISEAAGSGRKGRLHEAAAPPARMFADFALKVCLLGCIAAALGVAEGLPAVLRSFLFGMGLYFLLSAIMDGPGAAVSRCMGLRVSPHFDRPWLSTSVASFWNRRWDLAAGNVLRQLVFDCVMEGRLVPSVLGPPTAAAPQRPAHPSGAAAVGAAASGAGGQKVHPVEAAGTPRRNRQRQLLGTLATFAASGLVHECIFWYITGRTTRGRWLCFFLLQVPVIVAEHGARRMLRRRDVRLPRTLLTAYTVAFVSGAAAALFWAPAEEAGVVRHVLSNVEAS